MARRKTEINTVNRPGMIRHGMEMPIHAVYGTEPSSGTEWICTDLNFYQNGKHIDVFLYNRNKKRWVMKPLSYGKIYDTLVSYMKQNGLEHTQVSYAYRLKNTFQKVSPTGKKTKCTGLKEANKAHWNRGNSSGVRLGYNGAPYTTNGKFGDPILYI